MANRILIVLTSTGMMTGTDKATGWYLPELAHPYKVLLDAGFKDIDIISPKGGKAPLDPGSVEAFKDDPICQWFQKDATVQELVNNTKTPDQIKSKNYMGVLYPGGHGPMFDLANDEVIAKITRDIYEVSGVVAAVCHGPAGLVPITLSNGESIVKGKKVTSFTNVEEDAVKLTECMPFALETKLIQLGASFSQEPLFMEHVVVDGHLITGQNPASSTSLANEMVKLLKANQVK